MPETKLQTTDFKEYKETADPNYTFQNQGKLDCQGDALARL